MQIPYSVGEETKTQRGEVICLRSDSRAGIWRRADSFLLRPIYNISNELEKQEDANDDTVWGI